MLIYKIFRRPEWNALREAGETAGAPIDLADGFIHLSTSQQVAETAAKHFAEESDLVLVAVDADALAADLKWEPSRGGRCFHTCTASCGLVTWSGTSRCRWGRPGTSFPRG